MSSVALDLIEFFFSGFIYIIYVVVPEPFVPFCFNTAFSHQHFVLIYFFYLLLFDDFIFYFWTI